MQRGSRARLAAIFVAVMALALTATAAWPQSNRTIKIILPFAPGGPAYNAIRILGQEISATGGPTIVVEPHPGAGTAIGTELVAGAVPDGNTLGVISNSFVLLPQTRKVNYDPLTDFAPIRPLTRVAVGGTAGGESVPAVSLLRPRNDRAEWWRRHLRLHQRNLAVARRHHTARRRHRQDHARLHGTGRRRRRHLRRRQRLHH